ncbi:hypothetical protein EC973_004662 [Apophysomyces ossiformis]|uniref:Uncharacterized protein n=1 Tax=Apophysomyces ossiformis TaxID=679940 RepID=A0A8H7BJZ2_9FUNG|nr:hypothetical protein EC973_004662 [Apophysomyces ossiformis]
MVWLTNASNVAANDDQTTIEPQGFGNWYRKGQEGMRILCDLGFCEIMLMDDVMVYVDNDGVRFYFSSKTRHRDGMVHVPFQNQEFGLCFDDDEDELSE